MRPSSALVPTLLTLVALGLGILVWSLQQQLNIAEAALAALPPKSTAATTVAAPVNDPAADARPETHAASAKEGPATTPASPPRNSISALENSLNRQQMAFIRKAAVNAQYAALFRKLRLAPAELEKLKILLNEKLSAWMDVFNSARAEGLDTRTNAAQIQKLVAELQAEAEDSIHALLGDSGFQEYQRHEQTRTQRALVNQIQLRLSYSSTPLQGDQAEQLVALLAAHGTIEAAPPEAAYEGPRATLTEAFIAQSQGFLSAEQIEAIRQFYRERSELNQLSQQVAQANSRRP